MQHEEFGENFFIIWTQQFVPELKEQERGWGGANFPRLFFFFLVLAMQYQVILPLLALLLASLDESDAKFNRLLSSRTVAGARQLPEDVDSKLSVRGGLSSDTSSPSLVDMAIAGALATMVGDIAMHPVDCIKTLQQSNAGVGLSMLGASKSIFKTQVGSHVGWGCVFDVHGLACLLEGRRRRKGRHCPRGRVRKCI